MEHQQAPGTITWLALASPGLAQNFPVTVSFNGTAWVAGDPNGTLSSDGSCAGAFQAALNDLAANNWGALGYPLRPLR